METIFKMENVSTDYLKNLFFEVQEGSFVTLIGPSGSGKSSLLMLCNRLVEPMHGEIFYKSKNIKDYDIPSLRRQIGMVFQSAHLFSGTVEENITYGPTINKVTWNIQKSRHLMEIVQLPNSYLERQVHELSGGEKQRVSLVRTLANEPELLLLDEPTSALDIRTIEYIEEALLILQREKGSSVVMVTHDLEQAKRLGTKTFFLKSGKILEVGETFRMFNHPETEELVSFLRGKK